MRSLPQIPSTKLGVSSVKAIAKRAEVPTLFAGFVIDARPHPISAMDYEKAMRVLMLEIPSIAKEYGAREEIPPRIQAECVRLVIEKFPKMAVAEIREAFRQWSVGEIKAYNAEFYKGQLSAGQLGRILAAYWKRRTQVESQYLEEVATQERKDRMAIEAASARDQFELDFIQKLQNPDAFESWLNVPFWYYNFILNRGYMELSKEEVQEVWEDAKGLAIETRKMTDKLPDDFEERRKAIARRLMVFRKIKRQDFCFEPCTIEE
ncbi:MAG: hypothetical protein AAF990_28610 [Bacteroidota bacterium]